MVLQCQDVTARRQAERDLRQLALRDPLTGLGNRTLLHDRLAHALDRTDRHPAGLAVIYLDLDRFKVINDSLGHDSGDEVLRGVADRLRRALRPEDSIAQLGGDEFAVLREDLTGPHQAEEIAIRIAHAVTGELTVRAEHTAHTVTVQASVGYVLAGPDHRRPTDLLRDADLAMYAAKASGPGRVQQHTPGMRLRATRRQQLETALRAAVDGQRIDVAFQPIVRLTDRATVGFEALARWTDPHLGPVSPAELIPVAEETDVIVDLGALVLHQACRELRRWQAARPQADLQLAVNVTARQLVHPRFHDVVRDVVALLPHPQHLEITETTLMESAGPAMTAVGHLKDTLGVSITIDDFGTGYSSLAYLTRLPLDGLKVDRSFEHGLSPGSSHDVAVVNAVLSLAGNLDLRVTAEGVETEHQAAQLHDLHCPYAQGYLYAQPLLAEPALRHRGAGPAR